MPFVSFEGIDGSGKTTQIDRLVAWLRAKGQTVLQTKEPDGGRLGLDIRAILTRDRSFALDGVEELLLVGAARHDHVRSVIRPALSAGQWVLSDRFADSTFALQVQGKDAPAELYAAVSAAVVGDTWPDLTFILDIDPELAQARRQRRTSDRADPAEHTRDYGRIREGFALLAREEPGRCRLIDAAQDPDAVAGLIQAEVTAMGCLPA